jgi:phosphatidylglycerophosphate synthase
MDLGIEVMANNSEPDRFKDLLVEYGYRHLSRFELKYVARKNVIERVAFDLTNGDPTFQRVRDRVFRLPALAFLGIGITPNGISILGVAFAFAAALFVANPLLFAIFVLSNLICDGLDGVAARCEGSDSDFGSILDVFCDTVSLIVVSVGLTFSGNMHPLLFIPYVGIILAYTYRSALKNKFFDNIFLSIGSRILAFVGLVFISLCLYFGIDQSNLRFLVNLLFGSIFFILSVAYICDVAQARALSD